MKCWDVTGEKKKAAFGRIKRWTRAAVCLALAVVLGASPVLPVIGAEQGTESRGAGGLCEHHPAHDAQCGYAEAVEGHPCGHVHDESCGYQEAVEEIPCDMDCTDEDGDGSIDHQEGCAYRPGTQGHACSHIHDESCGYAEAVEGKPCTFVCQACAKENEAAPQAMEEYTITVPLASVGSAGTTFDLLDGVAVEPDTSEDGAQIQVRVKSVTSTDSSFIWDGSSTITPQVGGMTYTITYEAYVDETSLAEKEVTLQIMGVEEIGEKLDGDYAYLSEVRLLEDAATESGCAVRTGSAPWDEDDSDGNDTTDLNNTVRSFDIITYTAYFRSKVREDAPCKAYRTGMLHFEFILQGNEKQARFETESMTWLSAKNAQYTITEGTYQGNPCQVLRGSYLWEPSPENPVAIGEGEHTLTLVVRALALKKGDILDPKFTFWLDYNDVPEEGLVTDSGYVCETHGEPEYKTIDGPDIQVTTAPRYNVCIANGHNALNQSLGTFDFSTGNDLAQNKDAGIKEGRIQAFGAVIQIVGKTPQHGLRGCELPDGSPITFDLSLTSSYKPDSGSTIDPGEDYAPLLWSLDGNLGAGIQQADERSLDMVSNKYVYYVPLNVLNKYNQSSCCYNGGTWQGEQVGGNIQVTISDYEINLEQLPEWGMGSSHYYDSTAITDYWEIQTACFSAGEIWVIQPFYDTDGTYIASKYGSGTFQITLEDKNLQMTGESGTPLKTAADNSNQAKTTDDRVTQISYLAKDGTTGYQILYVKPTSNNPLTDDCRSNGKDWILNGNPLNIRGTISQTGAEGQARIAATDYLIKFDDTFFELESLKEGTDSIYGAKPDKSGWDHQGKKPNESGYDAEMMQATADDLIFFSSLEELEANGYTCVAVLREYRTVNATFSSASINLSGKVKEGAPEGYVFMVTHSAVAWSRDSIKAATAQWCGKAPAELTDEDYQDYVQNGLPSRADQMTPLNYSEDYPNPSFVLDYDSVAGLKNYVKTQYDESGYVNGSGGYYYGDSCLLIGYATEITKSAAQKLSGSEGNKISYDMDTGQRVVDYVLRPSAVRAAAESSTAGELITTVYVEDTLPKGLTYIIGSSYWGGTYQQTAEGKQGVVEGGQQIEPEITVQADGRTTLRWTLENVRITSEERTQIDPIYYSCDIGKPGDEENDVQNNEQLLNTVKVWSANEQSQDFTAENYNLATCSILISKNIAVSLSKLTDQVVVDRGETIGFTMNVGNNSANPVKVIAIDSLPYTGKETGSSFTGGCVVKEYTITSLAEEFSSNFKLYYTTEESERGKGSSDYVETDFTGEGTVWRELTVDPADGSVTLPEGVFQPVAIAAVGTLPAQKTLKMHVTIDLPDAKPGEYVANRLTRGTLESFARSYIVSRSLEGLTWLDTNRDGIQNEGNPLSGVKVSLWKLEDGEYVPYCYPGTSAPVEVETGKQVDVLTGSIEDYEAGRYKFQSLPAGTFAVKFEDGSYRISQCIPSPVDQGSNDTKDSDGIPAYAEDGKTLSHTWIQGITLRSAAELAYGFEETKYHDSGFYTGSPALPKAGGMGTTLLYVVGAILLMGAGALLVTKKRAKDVD